MYGVVRTYSQVCLRNIEVDVGPSLTCCALSKLREKPKRLARCEANKAWWKERKT